MADNSLKLQVLFNMVDKVTRPLKAMLDGNKNLAAGLKNSRAELAKLNKTQDDVDGFRKLRTGLAGTTDKLKETEASIKAMAKGLRSAGPPSQAMVDALDKARASASKLRKEQRSQAEQVDALRVKLSSAGIDTRNLSTHEQQLRGSINATTAAVAAQTAKLQAANAAQQKLAASKARMAKIKEAGIGAGMTAGVMGAGGLAAVGGMVGAYADQENASTDLKAAMMGKGGTVPDTFAKVNELATRLGDKLPGTTADFQNMMTMLIRQGIPVQSVLGGVGEAAAYLGVQLKKDPAEAAEFMSKLQDATRTADGDMLGLGDTIQRTFMLGVDSENMLQFYSKTTSALGILGMKGKQAADALAPLAVMSDQSGMAGEAAGNAVRKVLQMTMDAKKVAKGAKMAGVKLDFTNGKGEFGGFDKLFAQMDKLKGLSTQKKLGVLKTIFGDDAETLQVVSLLIDKGKAGYVEVQQKMAAQATMQERVNVQLGTLKNLWDAATGTFTNSLASFGETISPELKGLSTFFGDLSSKVSAFVAANPEFARVIVLCTALFSGLLVVAGGLAVAVSVITLPMLAVAGAIAAVVAIGVTLYENWGYLTDKAKELWEWVTKIGSAAGSWIGDKLGISANVSADAPTIEGVPINVAPDKPLTSKAGGSTYTSNDTYEVNIHDANDPKAVGAEVKRQLAAHANNKRLAASNRLED
jgi:TP901 family phage tail tape measure protein